ncbi:MAG TPA: LapD/MoxY N-terminal periplasmic domain-containing protein [Burkholderiaceae bacterium]|nr:LapD/MoxY N-terminal periplasmic domain-containing protein [Burkholderiaceae bacterium]
MSLIRRVSLLMLLVVVLALVGGVVTTLIAARDTLQAQLNVKNRDNAQALALALSQQRGDAALMELVLAAQFDTGHYRRIEWIGSDGRSMFRREADAAASKAPNWFTRWLPVHAEPGVAQVSDGWRAIGQLQLVSQSSYALDALWRAGLRAAELLALVGVLGGLLAAWGLRAIRRPLDAAVEQADALQRGQFVTVDEPKVAELKPLARSMNTMVSRLSVMFDAQAKQVESMRQQAQTDALTGLFNRRQFMLEAQQRFDSSSGDVQAVLLWRVQDLEGLNRRLGHAAVDRMLRSLAQTLGSGDADDQPLLGRLNGSDFVLAVSRLDAETLARSLMARVRGALAGDECPSVVVGVAEAAQSVGLPAAMAAADRALAQAEAEGPYTVVARTCAGSVPALGEGDWQRQLLQALDEQRSNLAEYPVRDAAGVLMHLDCPLRVQLRRDGAFESAAHWLALATRSRLTTALDQRAVSLALQKNQRDGVARCVNLAAASLLATEFVAAVSVQLQAAPQAAAGLWIDIPESLAVSHPGVIQELTRRWRPLGVHVGLEHAGAALSGMTRLYELGLDYVRIDARFLGGIGQDADVRRHAEGLVALLRGIGLGVYAEGVTQPDDLRALSSLGFDGATGPAVTQR